MLQNVCISKIWTTELEEWELDKDKSSPFVVTDFKNEAVICRCGSYNGSIFYVRLI